MRVWLENAYSRPFWDVFWVKMGKRKLFAVLSLQEYNSLGLMSYESNRVKIASVVYSGREQKLWSQKYKKKIKTTLVISHPFAGTPHWGDWFGLWHMGSHRRHNHQCQILWQSVQGFRSSDTPILLFSS